MKPCHSSKDVTHDVDTLIENIALDIQIPKEVIMRKKWLSSLYQHVVFKRDEQDLPDYLLGWRYDLLTKPLIQMLNNDADYLSLQMRVDD
ncbi:hypothetical protein V5M36_07830 [Acinetobacter sp. KS-LM10]|uniref:hypothetical protein n=1 Tax=Acinetobacter sp. KS-LM10 TaxID=3120518 RepID=UPI0030D3D2FB